MEGIIPTVSAEPAPETTDDELCNTNPLFLLMSGAQATLTFDPAMTSKAEKDMDAFLQDTHIDASENSALRGTSEADSEGEVETVAPTADIPQPAFRNHYLRHTNPSSTLRGTVE